MLKEKYKSIIDLAEKGGVTNLKVEEKGKVLHITGSTTEAVKQKLWDAYTKMDPDMRAGDLTLDIEATNFDEVYEIKKGDSLSKIAKQYGTTWQKIYEMNKDVIKNPDVIFPGHKIKIPKA
ncbi:MAG TPA: LysM peptidoglycan-binding domain-containing protein [Chryseolinea sp.]|nr:LysM peptidoglycan-binding domain-containing protein [Chryseolinea sp.]